MANAWEELAGISSIESNFWRDYDTTGAPGWAFINKVGFDTG
jgi:hypothetical protein